MVIPVAIDKSLGILNNVHMSSSLRDRFPFGDVDARVAAAVADRFPGLPAGDVVAALELGKSVISLLEMLPAPIEQAGLSPARWRLLIALMFQAGDNGATVSEIAGHLGVREPTVTATVRKAEDAGHVTRRRDDRDGRVVRVRITQEGQALVAGLMPVVADRIATFVAALGGADQVRAVATQLNEAADAVAGTHQQRSET